MGWRTRGLIALTWVATVSVTSGVIWWAISSTGTQVGTMPQVRVAASQSPHTDADGASGWSGVGGRIVARCDEDKVTLRNAVPNDGYTVEIKDRGPDHLRIEFRRSDNTGEQEVRITCGPGGPVYGIT